MKKFTKLDIIDITACLLTFIIPLSLAYIFQKPLPPISTTPAKSQSSYNSSSSYSSGSSSSYSSGSSYSNSYSSSKKCQYSEGCNSIATHGSFCSYHKNYLDDIYNDLLDTLNSLE